MVEVALAALLRMFPFSFLDDWLAQRANAFLTQTFKPATAPPYLPSILCPHIIPPSPLPSHRSTMAARHLGKRLAMVYW